MTRDLNHIRSDRRTTVRVMLNHIRSDRRTTVRVMTDALDWLDALSEERLASLTVPDVMAATRLTISNAAAVLTWARQKRSPQADTNSVTIEGAGAKP